MDDEPSQGDIDAICKWIDADASRRERLESLPYDGVHGLPPEWMPDPVIERFRRNRDYLLNISPSDFLVCHVEVTANGGDPIIPGDAQDSAAWIQTVHELAHVLYASRLSVSDGLKAVGGQISSLGHARREQQRQFGQRRGTERKQRAARNYARWQAEADKTKQERPSISGNKRKLAEIIKKRLGLPESISTIRRHIT